MADSRDWEKKTGSAPEGGAEKTRTTIPTERFRSGDEERRHTDDTTRSGADERRHGADSVGVKSYPAEYASGTSGSDEPTHGATVRGGERGGRYGEGPGGRFEEQPGGVSMDRRPSRSHGQSDSYGREEHRGQSYGGQHSEQQGSQYGGQSGQQSSRYGGHTEQHGRGGGDYGRPAESSHQRSGGTSQYRGQAAQTGTHLKDEANRMAEEARERGKGFLESQKSTAADSLERFASILHETGERLEDDQPTFSDFFHRGADSVDRFAGILRERDTETMLNQFQDFARRQPGLLLGGAVAAGFFLSRVLKSSAHRPESAYAEHRFHRSDEEREFFDTSDRMRAYREVGQDVPTTTMEDYHGRE